MGFSGLGIYARSLQGIGVKDSGLVLVITKDHALHGT